MTRNTSEGVSLYFLDPDGHTRELHHSVLNIRFGHYRANLKTALNVTIEPVFFWPKISWGECA
ncbi:hypothetical protein MN186_08685 [Aliiroseovarius sp. N1F302]|uniref:hypothetical protein n=1 Tax=Aliiroseovarius sediminis TaxID=2925839 RepID=UPI001F59E015|nr:hypothetical protein [Aliiroseovarius sediminis]MCI2394546.1 hypothetical protein [Aliiroseovarius sediminis]